MREQQCMRHVRQCSRSSYGTYNYIMQSDWWMYGHKTILMYINKKKCCYCNFLFWHLPFLNWLKCHILWAITHRRCLFRLASIRLHFNVNASAFTCFSPQVRPLRLRSGQRAVADEGELRQATQWQPVAQCGGVPGCQQRAHAQDRLTHRYSALQWSPQPGPQR